MLPARRVGHHLGRRHHAQLHVGVGVHAGFGQVVAQQEVVHRIFERNRELEALPIFRVAVVPVLHRQRDRLPVDVLDGGHVHRRLRRAQTHRNRQRHRAQEVRGVVFLVDHLVADQRPARRLVELHVQPLLFVEAQRVGHDQRRGAGDGDEADLQILLFQRRLVLRHRFECAQRQQRGDGRAGRAGTDRLHEAAAQRLVREQRLHQRGFDEAGARRRRVGGGRMVATTGATQRQRAVGVVRIEAVGGTHLLTPWMGSRLRRRGAASHRGGSDLLVGLALRGSLPSLKGAGATRQTGCMSCRTAYNANSTSLRAPDFSRMRAR